MGQETDDVLPRIPNAFVHKLGSLFIFGQETPMTFGQEKARDVWPKKRCPYFPCCTDRIVPDPQTIAMMGKIHATTGTELERLVILNTVLCCWTGGGG
jgi:hypothetical protein